jgi:hypothetical protein
MDPSVAFYQTLTSVSFTLLGLWFGVMQFSHGGWRSDPVRHRSTMHIALHFFLPGVLGLGSMLGSSAGNGLVWRVTFVIGGLIGLFESIVYLTRHGLPMGIGSRVLRVVSPLLWALLVVASFLPARSAALTSLQLEGAAVALIFVCGLCYVWLAFAERGVPADHVDGPAGPAGPLGPAGPVGPVGGQAAGRP